MATEPFPRFQMRHRMELALEYGDVSVVEIAAAVGISRTTVSNYIHGRSNPRRSDLVVWADRCGVPFDWLVEGIEPVEPAPEVPIKKTTDRSKRARTQDSKYSRCSNGTPALLHNVRGAA